MVVIQQQKQIKWRTIPEGSSKKWTFCFGKALLFGMLFLRALTISLTRAACCTMTLKTNVFKWAGHWHDGGSNVFKSFLSTPKCFTRHAAFIWWKKKCWCEAKHPKHVSPSHLISAVDKVLLHKRWFHLFALQWFWSSVWALCSPGTYLCVLSVIPTANCRLSHEKSGVLLAFSNTSISSESATGWIHSCWDQRARWVWMCLHVHLSLSAAPQIPQSSLRVHLCVSPCECVFDCACNVCM